MPAGVSRSVQRNIQYWVPKRQQAWNWGGQGFAWKFIGQTSYSPDFVNRDLLFSWPFSTQLTVTIYAKTADMKHAVASRYRHWILLHRLCIHNLKQLLNIYDKNLQVWLFYSLNTCRVFFKLRTTFPYTTIPTFIIYFLISFWYQILTSIHKIYFQIQSNSLPTWTPANPFGAKNLSRSSKMSLNFYSNKCTMAFLPGTVLVEFWAWTFATENKRHFRCSSSILQDVTPTHWKCFNINTPLIQIRVNTLNPSYHLCFSRNCTQYIIMTNVITTHSNSYHIYIAHFNFDRYAHSSAANLAKPIIVFETKLLCHILFLSLLKQ